LSNILSVDKKTVFRWIEEGLIIIPGCKKPILIKGANIKKFLNNKKLKRRVKLSRSEFFCLTCKSARFAKKGTIKKNGNQKKALCRVCNGKISRIY
jgi:hypothetical protein